jgi:hypothetical protein
VGPFIADRDAWSACIDGLVVGAGSAAADAEGAAEADGAGAADAEADAEGAAFAAGAFAGCFFPAATAEIDTQADSKNARLIVA